MASQVCGRFIVHNLLIPRMIEYVHILIDYCGGMSAELVHGKWEDLVGLSCTHAVKAQIVLLCNLVLRKQGSHGGIFHKITFSIHNQ
jgi:hypothetical protein